MCRCSVLARYKIGWEHILLTIVVAVGLAARLHEIHYNLDGDEIFSVELASKQFEKVISHSLQDRPHPPLHNVLLHLWIKVFGASEVSVRALSILFSGVFLFISYTLLHRLVAPWLALGALLMIALSPLFVYYGQQARPYALSAFLSAANLLTFIRVLEAPCMRRRLAVWAASCAFLLHAQYLAALLIAFQIGFALFHLRSERLAILAYGSVGSMLILPWLIAAMGSEISSGTDPLPQISWITAPTPTNFVWFYVSIFGEAPGLRVRWLLVVLTVLGVAYIRHLAASKSLPASHALLLYIGIAVPAAAYALSVWGPKSVFVSRQLLGAAVAFAATIELCMATLPRSLAAGLLLTLLAWTAAALPGAFPHNSKPPWRDVAALLDRQHGSVPVVAQEGWVREPLAYYRKAGSARLWSELTDYEKGERFLFVCRPFKCSDIESGVLAPRYSLLATWCWGRLGCGEFNQLRLYEIRGAE